MKEFLKKNKAVILFTAVLLLIVGGWLLFWGHLGKQVEKAAYQSAYEQLVFGGAYYAQCDLDILQEYLPDVQQIDESLLGEQLGELSFPSADGMVICPLYACKPMQDAGKKNAVVLLKQTDDIFPYELSGFQYLDEQTSIWAVCASYGIGYGSDLEAVIVKDADGKLLDTITDSDKLDQFVKQFLSLGEDIGEAGQAQAYYDAYTAEFGKTDQIWLENGTVKAADDAAYQKAMEFWTQDLRLITIKLKNGYQLRNCIYTPIPKTFSVYGDYAFTEPFFS